METQKSKATKRPCITITTRNSVERANRLAQLDGDTFATTLIERLIDAEWRRRKLDLVQVAATDGDD